MKKVLLLAVIALFACSSCKKEYACECTTSNTIYNNGVALTSGPTKDDVEIGKMTKRDARKKCESMNGTISTGDTKFGTTSEIGCSLK